MAKHDRRPIFEEVTLISEQAGFKSLCKQIQR